MNNKRILRLLAVCLMAALVLCLLPGCDTAQEQEDCPLVDGAIYKITSALNSRVMEASNFGLMEGNYVQSMDYQGDLNQVWKAHKQADGTWAFENMSTLRYLTVKKESVKAGAYMGVCTRDEGNVSQSFTVEKADTGYDEYSIISVLSGLTLELEDNEKAKGTKIVQNEKADVLGQYWYFDMVDDGSTKLPYTFTIEGSLEHSSCPEISHYGDMYYCWIMGDGVSIKQSSDLVHWEYVGSAMPKPTSGNTMLSYGWQEEEIPGGNLVAPGVYKLGDQYCLYYAVTTGGSQRSFIGLLTNTTLDRTDPNYKWVDKGIVICSYQGDPYNCIDPNVIIDEDGQPWLVWGSWWTGIYMRKLDINTGYLDETDPELHHLGSQGSSATGVEAPYIIYRDGYYYLFVAQGDMGKGTYQFAVSRSESIFGPYVDRQGRKALDGYYSPVTSQQEGVTNPGHASVFLDDDGTYYLVSEYFWERSPSLLYIGTLEWDEDGWPYSALLTGIFD
ncbi:MAG: family 43 glycosylhydrolase [Oscillospiraceae bacterium]|nr:family 43 glycosylhydrolase [Oscillospiraceae bacterium]